MRLLRRAATPPTRRAALLAAVAALAVFSAPAGAQATRDQARLVFTIFGSWARGGELWGVANQPVVFPITDPPDPSDPPLPEVDSLAVSRRTSSGIGAGLSATYYPGPILGYVAEVSLLGTGYEDDCTIVSPPLPDGSPGQAVCGGIRGADRGASLVMLSVGLVARAMSQQVVSPYVRGGIGLAVASQSSLRMFGPLDTPEGDIFLVYDDDTGTRITPAFILGGGLTAQVGPGWQLRAEARDNIVGLASVSAPASRDGLVPPHETRLKHLWTVSLGVDIVLERKRGRRY